MERRTFIKLRSHNSSQFRWFGHKLENIPNTAVVQDAKVIALNVLHILILNDI
jgi:hypothetical protein